MKHCYYLIVLTLCTLLQLQAQNRIYRQYATQEVMARLEKEDPGMLVTRSKIEQLIDKEQKRLLPSKTTIPIVIHIVHNGANRPSVEDVTMQLEALNKDFSGDDVRIKHPADTSEGYFKRVAKTEIDFCISKVDPSGKNADAVRFVPTTVSSWETDDAMKFAAKGGANAWDTKKFLNIWVVNLRDGITGYAQMPGGPESTDGIVIDSKFFGLGNAAAAPYNKGKTLTHLIGTYLGLYELWNDYQLCADDYVEDTPIHNAPNTGTFSHRHISTCYDNPVEMTMNFMDNTDDDALTMFTFGQKARMLALLSKDGPRSGLLDGKVKCDKKINFAEEALASPELDVVAEFQVSLYPNPTSQDFTLEVNTKNAGRMHMVAYSSIGAVVQVIDKQMDAGSYQIIVPSSNWPNGVYFIHTQINGRKDLQKLILNK
jgi:hypothetical protein